MALTIATEWASPKVTPTYFYAYTISVGGFDVGTFERFSQRSTRTVERIREVKASQPIPVDMVWTGADTSLELNRVELFSASLMAVFGAQASLDFLVLPLEVKEILYTSSAPGPAVPKRIITFSNCVVSDYSKEISTGQARVVETMTVQVQTIAVTVS